MARKDVTDRMVCEAAEAFHANTDGPNVEQILVARTGQHWRVCNAALERADRRGLIDCGVSLRTAWLEPKGRELLERERWLDAHGRDPKAPRASNAIDESMDRYRAELLANQRGD